MAKALSLVAYNDLESQVEALERDGYVYFPNVLDTDEIAELRATMERLQAIPESHDRDETLQNGDKFLHKLISNSFIVDSENKFTFSEIYVSIYDYGIFNRFTQTRA